LAVSLRYSRPGVDLSSSITFFFTMLFLYGFLFLITTLGSSARSIPGVLHRRDDFLLANGQQAIALNAKFQTLNADSPCNDGDDACVEGKLAQCVRGAFVLTPCAPGTICAALPLVNSPGTSIACTTLSDLDARIAATGATGGGDQIPPSSSAPPDGPSTIPPDDPNNPPNDGSNGSNGGGDPQTCLTLNSAVIASDFANDGQDTPTTGQVPSLTSTNNFINFCLTVRLPLTDGKQIPGGSCNPAPMGVIPSKDKMPASKFVFPTNGDTVPVNQSFTIQLKIQNLETGNFVNAKQNYFSAPQQLNDQGVIKGHSHVVIQQLPGFDSTDILDPQEFAFFRGFNEPDQGGVLTADVTDGLPVGVYRLASINTASNHQPVLAPVAQHGFMDDVVYFTVA